MKTFPVLITVAAIATFASAEECKESDLVTKFVPLLSDGNYATCQTDAGYTFYPFTGPPTDAQVTKICASTACHSLLTHIHNLDLPSCVVTIEKATFNLKDAVPLTPPEDRIPVHFLNRQLLTNLLLMKTTAVVGAVVTTASFAFISSAEQCNESDLVTKFVPLLSDSNYRTCQINGGYTLYPFTKAPTNEQTGKLCASKACRALLETIQRMGLPNCEVAIENAQVHGQLPDDQLLSLHVGK